MLEYSTSCRFAPAFPSFAPLPISPISLILLHVAFRFLNSRSFRYEQTRVEQSSGRVKVRVFEGDRRVEEEEGDVEPRMGPFQDLRRLRGRSEGEQEV